MVEKRNARMHQLVVFNCWLTPLPPPLSLPCHAADALPAVVSRGDPPGPLTYGRLHGGSVASRGFTCKNANLRVGMLQPAVFSAAAVQILAPAIVDGQVRPGSTSA